ncbi:sensor histidine kinase [Sphingomonas rosea]|uniref:sensor histidine kinase n=1 Tax=Sphingomonas rosea TaxID=335605 RepID=UPI0031E14C0A
MRQRLVDRLGGSPDLTLGWQLLSGSVVGLAAAALRLSLPLAPFQIPTLPTVAALAVVTCFVGPGAGLATAVVGGGLSLAGIYGGGPWEAMVVPALSFTVIATTIIVTASLYRASERQRYRRELAEARRAAEDAVIFARELGHRLKNALTVVQSIALQTIGHEDPRAVQFAERLRTLADANALLSEHVSRPVACVREVVRAALAPFPVGERLITEVVAAPLPDEQVVSMALALHELATNAMKYGAWSNDRGLVHLLVEEAPEGGLAMTWTERGGPSVTEPTRRGFGSRLLGRAGQGSAFRFQPEGLQFRTRLQRA